jgi:Big-like domain-containing protein
MGDRLLIGRRAFAVLLTVLIVSLAVPAAVLAAVPVANDDPSIDCNGGDNFGGSYPIPEDYRVAGDFGEWSLFFGDCSLLANDTDGDDDPLTFEFVTAPAHGQAMKVPNEWFAYQVEPDYSTLAGDQPGGDWNSDSFTYHACDATDCSAPASMRFWIAPVNDPPTFTEGPSLVEVDEDSGPYSGAWATDISPGPANESAQTVQFEIVSLGVTGVPPLFAVEPAISSSGVLTFTPGPDQYGHAQVTVRARDDGGLENYGRPDMLVQPDDTSDEVTFEIVVEPVDEPVNHAPVADDDTLTVDEDAGPTAVPVLDGDLDADGDPLEIGAASDPLHGTVVVSGDGSALTYEPDPGYHGPDSFTYTIDDGFESDTATVSVTVVATPAPGPDVAPPVVAGPLERWLGQTVAARTTTARISWGATDAGSGVKSYKLQVSVDGGDWKTIALPKATTKSIDRTFTKGHAYQFRIRATDQAGNTSPYVTGPSLTPVRYSEASARITYVGAWKKTTSPKALGGAARNATASTKRATFTFTGYDVGWIATRTASSGKARIFIDGILFGTVDLDQGRTSYRKLVFARHFPTLASHTLEIRPVGDGRVDIDGFVVLR